MSPTLLRWFTSYAPKHDGRKLPFVRLADGSYTYDEAELLAFDDFLHEPWPAPSGGRPNIPTEIEREIQLEAAAGCAFCHYMGRCEVAHIRAVAVTSDNHPHNLINGCPNHHTEYDLGTHKKYGVVGFDETTVIAFKERWLEAKTRLWRAEAQIENALVLLLNHVESLRRDLESATPEERVAIERQATDGLVRLRQAAGSERETASPSQLHLQNTLAAVDPVDVLPSLKRVAKAREEYLRDTSEEECPLCEGHGFTPRYHSCPACDGKGTVSVEHDLDLTLYEFVNCPVCDGDKQLAGYGSCPACSGAGTTPKFIADEMDVGAYALVRCSACSGRRRTRRGNECAVCEGKGLLPQHVEDDLDLDACNVSECPLCKGARRAGWFDECPICRGAGEVSPDAEDVDLAPYTTMVTCPSCRGKRSECEVCRGIGKVPQVVADDL